MDKLKPCPLCGGEARIADVSISYSSDHVNVVCSACGLTLPWHREYAIHEVFDTMGMRVAIERVALNESAFEAWNRRAHDETAY